MKKIILNENQLRYLIEVLDTQGLFNIVDKDYISKFCKKGLKKFELGKNPWCFLKEMRTNVSDDLKKSLNNSIEIMFNFYKRPYTKVLPKIIELSLNEAYKERAISFLKSIADFINNPEFDNDKTKKALKSLGELDVIPEDYLSKILENARMKEYSKYEKSFEGQNFDIRRGKLTLNYKCGDFIDEKNFTNVVKKIKQNPKLFDNLIQILQNCLQQSFVNENAKQKGDLITKTDLFTEKQGIKTKIFSTNSSFEVKKMDYGVDSYLSEFFSIFKNKSTLSLKPDYLEIYNKIIQSLFEWCQKNGTNFLNMVSQNLSGIIFENNIIVPMKYIQLYWSNRGQKGCDEKRLSIRFKVSNQNQIIGYKYTKDSDVIEEILLNVTNSNKKEDICT